MNSHDLPLFRQTLGIDSSFYPERYQKCRHCVNERSCAITYMQRRLAAFFIINAPWIFKPIWAIVRLWLAPRTSPNFMSSAVTMPQHSSSTSMQISCRYDAQSSSPYIFMISDTCRWNMVVHHQTLCPPLGLCRRSMCGRRRRPDVRPLGSQMKMMTALNPAHLPQQPSTNHCERLLLALLAQC